MSIRTETLARIFAAWLERYSPPAMMKDKPAVMQAEIDALMRAVLRFAPQADYDGWLNRTLDQLECKMKTRAWPTKSELVDACSKTRKEMPTESTVKVRTPLSIMAKRMAEGEAVGDEWLYGRNAIELMRSGEVEPGTFRKYRSALFFAMKDVMGEELAKVTEAGLIRKHEEAEGLWRSKQSTPPRGEPFKRMVQA
jgi:hypothetical protein